MEQLNKQVRKAQRQLGLQRFMGTLGWCSFVTLMLALAVLLVDRLAYGLGLDVWFRAPVSLGLAVVGAGLALGAFAAALWAVIRGRGPIDAAIEIDRRFGLKERVSSALAMSDGERGTPLGRALVDDAIRRVRGIDVREHFAVSPGRQILLPVIPAVAAILIALFVPPITGNQAKATPNPVVKKQIERSTEGLKRKLVEKRKRAEEQGLKDAEELFKRLEEASDDLPDRTKGDRKQALVKLNDLARQIKERRQDLGGAEQIRKQLEQLKNIQEGPADEFLKAVKEGDFRKAMEELNQLKSKLADGNLSDEDREKLANQVQQMAQKLQDLADAHREARQDLERRVNEARQAGREDEAEKLQEQLDKLHQQAPQMEQLQNLADKLGKCAQCLQGGQLQDAENALDQLQGDLDDLREQLQELDMLNDALAQCNQCRDQMNCPNCGGMGCAACQGNKKGGMGLGAGRGEGPRPEAEDEVDFIDTRPPMKVGPGAASVVGEAEGPLLKGDVQQEMKEQVEAARRQAADPVTVQHLPRGYQDHAMEYLDRIREGD